MLLAGDIDMGHARALLATDAATQIQLANEVIARRLSVRDTEKLVNRRIRDDEGSERNGTVRQETQKSGDLKRLEEALSDALGTPVSIKVGAKDKGQLQIAFHGWDHLNALLERQGLGAVLASQ
jgi:ParB family chromosome partitioning protein